MDSATKWEELRWKKGRKTNKQGNERKTCEVKKKGKEGYRQGEKKRKTC